MLQWYITPRFLMCLKTNEGGNIILLWNESRTPQLQTASFLMKAYVPNCKPLSFHSSV